MIKTTHGGHGGKNDFDPGAVSAFGREVDIAREINQLIINRTGAVNTSDSLGTTVNQNLANITQNINRVASDSDWNLSIHLNSATPSATGVEVFAFGGDAEGMAKASQVSKAIANVLGIPDRGAKDGSGLYVIRNTKGHTLLIEVGFVSNANDVAQIRAKKEQVADAIVACFSGGSAPAPKPPVTVPPVKPPVQSGYAREYKENGTMYATERNWVKNTPTKGAPIVEWQEVGQGIKYHTVLWNDGIVWLGFTGWDGKQRFVAYADANGTGFGRKYGYCV